MSIVTPWEIARKPVLRKAGFSSQLVQEHLQMLGARLLRSPSIIRKGFISCPHIHEAFDHMIIAQALVENCPVISIDQRFPLYESEGLKVLWDD